MSGGLITFDGKTPVVDPTAFIAHNAVLVGEITVGAESGIWYNVVMRGDFDAIVIGKRTNIQDGTVVHADNRTSATHIGDDVTVGHMALIHACTLADGCMVGMNATVMDEAVIGAGALVAARALIPPGKNVPAGELWAGAPARKIRDVEPEDRALMDYILPSYRDLAARYREQGLDLRMRQDENST